MWGCAFLFLSIALAQINGEDSPVENPRLSELSDLLLALAPSRGALSRAPVSNVAMAHHVQWKATKKHNKLRPKKSMAERERKERTRQRKAEEGDFMDEYAGRPWYTKTGSGEVPDATTLALGKPADEHERRLVAQKTWYPQAADTASANKEWRVVDATDARVGRLASEIAKVLLGKDSPTYTPGQSSSPYVIVTNAEKAVVSGKKFDEKLYRRHSGRPGGMKIESFKELQARIPERIIEKAVKGMLPHNAYGRDLFRQLKVFAGPEHPHAAQKPQEMQIQESANVYKPLSKLAF